MLYGAATSAHRVEGGNTNNDFWEREKKRPVHLRSGKAVDHFHRFENDFSLAAQFGHNLHFLTLEWSRIEPMKGSFSKPAIQHYRDVLTSLQKKNIVPIVALHDKTNPLWFARSGGWEQAMASEEFTAYAQYAISHLADLAHMWVPFTDPLLHSMWQAHAKTYRIIHRLIRSANVGVVGEQSFFTRKAKHDFLIHPLSQEYTVPTLKNKNIPTYILDQRGEDIPTSLRAIEEAQKNGSNIRGYLYDSLLDSYELDTGSISTRGLFAVHPETFVRTPRHNAYVLKAVIELL